MAAAASPPAHSHHAPGCRLRHAAAMAVAGQDSGGARRGGVGAGGVGAAPSIRRRRGGRSSTATAARATTMAPTPSATHQRRDGDGARRRTRSGPSRGRPATRAACLSAVGRCRRSSRWPAGSAPTTVVVRGAGCVVGRRRRRVDAAPRSTMVAACAGAAAIRPAVGGDRAWPDGSWSSSAVAAGQGPAAASAARPRWRCPGPARSASPRPPPALTR